MPNRNDGSDPNYLPLHGLDSDRENFLVNQERERLWKAMQAHWRGDMGPAFIIVNEIRHLFVPEAPAD